MEEGQRIILGIDPGTMILGYGVILIDRRKVHFVDMGVVDLRREKDSFAKLNTIFTEVSGIIGRYSPDDVAVEAPFYGKTDALAIAMCHFYQLVNPLADTATSTNWEKFIKAHPDRVK